MPDQDSAAGPPARPEQTIAGARAPVRDARVRVFRGRPPHHGLLRQKLRRDVRHRTSIQCAPLRPRICVSGVDVSTARSSRSTTLHLARCIARRYRHDNDGALLEITDGLEITPKVPTARDRILSHPLVPNPCRYLSVRIGSGRSSLADHSGEGRTRDHQGAQPKRLGAFVLLRSDDSRICRCRRSIQSGLCV
jgi:hypothetical protein